MSNSGTISEVKKCFPIVKVESEWTVVLREDEREVDGQETFVRVATAPIAEGVEVLVAQV